MDSAFFVMKQSIADDTSDAEIGGHLDGYLDVVRLLRLRVVSQADPVDTCGIEAQD